MRDTMIRDKIYQNRVIAISRGIPADRIVDTAQAISRGGIKLFEVTFVHDSHYGIKETQLSIEKLSSALGNDIIVGTGTVLTTDEVHMAADASAAFIISPDTNTQVIEETKKLGLVSIPGAMTPTEIVRAYDAGADFVKVFPASVLGVDYIKAVKGPLRHIPLIAVGGINKDNAAAFLSAGVAALGIGGNLVDRKALLSGDFRLLTERAQSIIKAVSAVST
ncbi:MAG: bifunctional 4-hydroxy-2-oxoglutarate aldolase/2-dehydro-3-deoxy-phosphogluconate aldolase [Clostridia bacterium]|nr:bifunctional 4-hydroxy-2-oxoglutarate aldolase/2-dehydro-3-deoxy-phosphogluconate aldolase [Clostridia bacterium]